MAAETKTDVGSVPCTAWKRACTCISVPRPSARRWRASANSDGVRSYLCGPAYVPRPNRQRAAAAVVEASSGGAADQLSSVMRLRWVRRVGLGMAGTLAVCLLIAAMLWCACRSGPISLDMITPWLTAAIAEKI